MLPRSLVRVLQSANVSYYEEPGHPLASAAYHSLRTYKELTDYESRLQDLVDYYGFEVGHKAPYCRIYAGEKLGLPEKLGIAPFQYSIMHMHALFNRMDPARKDMFWIFDDILSHAFKTFGKDFCIVDFGCGLGTPGLSFASVGVDTHFVDVQPQYLGFINSRAKHAGIEENVTTHLLPDPHAYETLRFPKPVAAVIEWSSFEHIESPLRAYRWCHRVLAPKGQFVTTTAVIDWDEELEAHFLDDAGPARFKELRSDEYTNLRRQFNDIKSYDKSLAVSDVHVPFAKIWRDGLQRVGATDCKSVDQRVANR